MEKNKKETKKVANYSKEEIRNGIIVVVLIIAVIGGFFVLSEFMGDRSIDKVKPETVEQENPLLTSGEKLDNNKMKKLDEVDFTKFMELLNGKEKVAVFIGSATCHWCVNQKPLLQSVMYTYDLDVKYLDVSKMTNEENQKFIGLNSVLAEGYGTPMFFVVGNGKVITLDQEGARGTESLIEMYKDQGFIK